MPAASVTVNAKFKRDYNNVTVNPSDHGTVTSDQATAAKGTTVTLTVTPEKGYGLNSLTVTDSDNQSIEVSNDYTFTMPDDDVTVTADFKALEQTLNASLYGAQYGSYTVKVNDGEAVSVSGNGSTEITGVKTGDSITVTFSPAENGRIDEFYYSYFEDGTSYKELHHESDVANNSYTFTMLAASPTVFVKFVYANKIEKVNYVDENGDPQSVEALVLTGEEPVEYRSIGGFYYYTPLGRESDYPSEPAVTWYVVKNDIDFSLVESSDRNIELTGDVRIIVADGATLTVQGQITGGKLSVYGQTAGTGKIIADSVNTTTDVCSAELSVGSFNNDEDIVTGEQGN